MKLFNFSVFVFWVAKLAGILLQKRVRCVFYIDNSKNQFLPGLRTTKYFSWLRLLKKIVICTSEWGRVIKVENLKVETQTVA